MDKFHQKNHHEPLPNPPIFKVSGLKYTVPPYYNYLHSETQWLINMLKSDNWDRIFRIINANPDYLKNTYCQYPDTPPTGPSMFHRNAVLYLTPLGLAIYLLKDRMVQRILFYISQFDDRYDLINQPCFVTNYLERFENRNDIMMIYPYCIMIRRENFDSVPHLLEFGWKPQTKILIPYRRIFQIYTFQYKDIIEYTIAQMALRPNIQLFKLFEKLLQSLDKGFDLYLFEKVSYKYDSDAEMVDYVSIPRRLLRFLHYYDKDLLLLSQILLAIKTIQRFTFFVGPRYFSWDCKINPVISDDTKSKVCNDQDCIISLMLSLTDLVDIRGHNQAKEKLLELLAYILIDTKWFVKFLITKNSLLINYFSNLNENIQTIKNSTIDSIRNKLICLLDDISELNIKNIREIYNPMCPKNYWKNNLNLYIEKNCDKFKITEIAKTNDIYRQPDNQKPTDQDLKDKQISEENTSKLTNSKPTEMIDSIDSKDIQKSEEKPKIDNSTLKESYRSNEHFKPTEKINSIQLKDDQNLNFETARLSENSMSLRNQKLSDTYKLDDNEIVETSKRSSLADLKTKYRSSKKIKSQKEYLNAEELKASLTKYIRESQRTNPIKVNKKSNKSTSSDKKNSDRESSSKHKKRGSRKSDKETLDSDSESNSSGSDYSSNRDSSVFKQKSSKKSSKKRVEFQNSVQMNKSQSNQFDKFYEYSCSDSFEEVDNETLHELIYFSLKDID